MPQGAMAAAQLVYDAAQERLFEDMSPQKGFSFRLAWCGNCQDSAGRNATGKPVASLKARSYS